MHFSLRILFVAALGITWITLLVHYPPLPPVRHENGDASSFPHSAEDLERLLLSWKQAFEPQLAKSSEQGILRDDTDDTPAYWYAVVWFCLLYLWKQSFCMPGSALLNIWAGAIFPLTTALLIAGVMTCCGASFCYCMSKFVFCGSKELQSFANNSEEANSNSTANPRVCRSNVQSPHRPHQDENPISTGNTNQNSTTPVHSTSFFGRWVTWVTLHHDELQRKVEEERRAGELLGWLIGIRMVPFTPNWLLNIVLPHLGVSLRFFAPSIFFGMFPYNYVTCSLGNVLAESLTSGNKEETSLSLVTVLKLLGMAGMFLLIKIVGRKRRRICRGSNQ